MGFNIEVGEYRSLYISYNWSAFSDIFYIRDMQGQNGRYVSKKIKEALCKLIEMGHMPILNIPGDFPIDDWGAPKDGTKSDDWSDERYIHPRMQMFGWILTQFLEVAEQQPDDCWYYD